MDDKDLIHVVNQYRGDQTTTSCKQITDEAHVVAYFNKATCPKCRGEKNDG